MLYEHKLHIKFKLFMNFVSKRLHDFYGLKHKYKEVTFFLSFADISLCPPPQEGDREQLISGYPCQYI